MDELLKSFFEQAIASIKSRYTLVSDTLPETNGTGKCHRMLEVLYYDGEKIKTHYAWYSIAGFFSVPSYYAEHEIKQVIGWRYADTTENNQ